MNQRDEAVTVDHDHSTVSLIRRLRALGKTISGKAPSIWFTEVGYSTFNHYGNEGAYYWGFTQPAQAAYLVRMVALSLAADVSAVCIYDLKDDGNNIFEPENNFGLIDVNNQPKLSCLAFERLAKYLGGGHRVLATSPAVLECSLVKPVEDYEWKQSPQDPFVVLTGPQCYWFQTDKGVVTIFWRAGRYNTETNPPLCRFVYPKFDGVAPAETVDLVTGQSQPIQSRQTDDGTLILENLSLSSHPQVILWPAAAPTAQSK